MPRSCDYDDEDKEGRTGCGGWGVIFLSDNTEIECTVCGGAGEIWTKEELKRKKELIKYIRNHWDEDFDNVLRIMVEMKNKLKTLEV